MEKADGLSKRLDWQEGVKKDNKDQMLIKPEWVRGVETLVEKENLREKIKKVQEGDKRVVKAVKEVKEGRNKDIKR